MQLLPATDAVAAFQPITRPGRVHLQAQPGPFTDTQRITQHQAGRCAEVRSSIGTAVIAPYWMMSRALRRSTPQTSPPIGVSPRRVEPVGVRPHVAPACAALTAQGLASARASAGRA